MSRRDPQEGLPSFAQSRRAAATPQYCNPAIAGSRCPEVLRPCLLTTDQFERGAQVCLPVVHSTILKPLEEAQLL
jgi:hypothetical protein